MFVTSFCFWYLATPVSCTGDDRQIESRKRILTAHDELFAVHFHPSGSGWIVGQYGLILHSADGGKSWGEQKSNTPQPLTSISFADDRHGFAVGGGGTILATMDGGQSWRRQTSGSKEHLLAVQALDGKRAFAVGAFGTLLGTDSGGAAWSIQKLPWPALIQRLIRDSGSVEPNLNAVYFINDRVGWIAGEFGLILHTRDGGRTWRTQRYGSDLPQLTSLAFRDERQGWAVGLKGTLLMTADGGKSWRESSTPLKGNFTAIALGVNRGVVVGQGAALRSAEYGAGWTAIDAVPRETRLNGVALYKDNAVAVGQSGTIRVMAIR